VNDLLVVTALDNEKAVGLIQLAIGPEFAPEFLSYTVASELWDALTAWIFDEDTVLDDVAAMHALKKNATESVHAYFMRGRKLAIRIEDAGREVKEADLVYYLVRGLPFDYAHEAAHLLRIDRRDSIKFYEALRIIDSTEKMLKLYRPTVPAPPPSVPGLVAHGGPASGGPASGPASAGPASAGPASAGPASAGPGGNTCSHCQGRHHVSTCWKLHPELRRPHAASRKQKEYNKRVTALQSQVKQLTSLVEQAMINK